MLGAHYYLCIHLVSFQRDITSISKLIVGGNNARVKKKITQTTFVLSKMIPSSLNPYKNNISGYLFRIILYFIWKRNVPACGFNQNN